MFRCVYWHGSRGLRHSKFAGILLLPIQPYNIKMISSQIRCGDKLIVDATCRSCLFHISANTHQDKDAKTISHQRLLSQCQSYKFHVHHPYVLLLTCLVNTKLYLNAFMANIYYYMVQMWKVFYLPCCFNKLEHRWRQMMDTKNGVAPICKHFPYCKL